MVRLILLLVSVFVVGTGLSAHEPVAESLVCQYGLPEQSTNVNVNDGVFEEEDSTIFSVSQVDVAPRFPEGMDSVRLWITNHIDWSRFNECDVTGWVAVSFAVETDGSLTEIHILRDIGCHAGHEVAKAVSLMPKWIPGRLKGKEVRVRYYLRYSFVYQ
ncbi:MAG: energy transducer TonB [Bacteroidales bacterium]|nr:energy transducer TonB [Bacteroidales bacterium]